MDDFEKLGVFYLGRRFNLSAGKPEQELILYDSKDLVTHAVCVGMTGSGKTGLCVAMLEEAAIDGVPAIVIDPKGDLGNLLLTFPDLSPQEFAPWVNEDDARRKGLSPADYAAQQAQLWKEGLAKWGQSGERIKRLRDAAEFAIYTPGSTAGLPVSIIRSFDAPPPELVEDRELFQDRINTTVSSLLGLIGVEADPINSREHILLSTLFADAWKNGQNLDLAGIIQRIQQPPVTRVGVMDLDSFFPAKDRFGLAMKLNNLLAAPGFENWMAGEPLDVGNALYTPAGKPRVAIFSIAHLGDAERMFFVSLLLNQVVGWMRGQSGTTSLRAILYMDEIFGYFPPTANPPSKQPLLTLLKQARAFGLGVMLATQNPVDLDYKGLSNCGTWFIGRLQTERDKARVLDGLEGAAASAASSFDRGEMEKTLAGLGSRVFLMNNVHEDRPEIFETRWVMSYLRGPLTRNQIKALMDPVKGVHRVAEATPPAAGAARSGASPSEATDVSRARPVLPPDVRQYFVPVRSTRPAGATLVYEPMAFGEARVFFADAKTGAEQEREIAYLARFGEGTVGVDWDSAESIDLTESDLETEPLAQAAFAPVPRSASSAKPYEGWKKSLAESLFRREKLELLKSPATGEFSRAGESERDFRVRLGQAAREQRDAAVEQLRQKYAPKMAAIEERIRRAQQAVEREQSQASQSKWSTVMSVGASILGAVLGRKTMSAANVTRAASAARGAGRVMKESGDVGRAQENVEALQQQLVDLDAQFKEETDALEARFDAASEPLETVTLRPKKTNITVKAVALAWTPSWRDAAGTSTPAWE